MDSHANCPEEACDVPIELRMRANVFVKGLPLSVDARDLQNRFSTFGQVLSAKVVRNEDGKSLRYGYVQFASPDGAARAVAAASAVTMNGERLWVRKFVPKNERDKHRPGFTNIYVRNFPKSVAGEEDLKNMFSCFGDINSVFLAKGDDTSLKGFGFVNFVSHGAAQEAVRVMNEKKIGNRKLYVAAAQTKEERARILAGWVGDKDQPVGQVPVDGETIIVKNLPYTTNGGDLRELFEPFGSIYLTKIAVTHDGKSRGFGFVHFESSPDAEQAVKKMHLTRIGGRRVSVALAAQKGASIVSQSSGALTLPSASMPLPPIPMLPGFQCQQMCYPAYQFAIPNQSMPLAGQIQNNFVNVPQGYVAGSIQEGMSPSADASTSIQSKEGGKVFPHGVGARWSQPYYWPASTGAGIFSGMIGPGQTNPYAMMGAAVHPMTGTMGHAGL